VKKGQRRFTAETLRRREKPLGELGGLAPVFRRFTRLTNGFSRKFENYWAALALYFAFTISAGFTVRSA